MLRHYLNTAWRNVKRNKSFAIINIGGLAVGMACVLIISLWIQYEVSFDRFHLNKYRLYEVLGQTKVDGNDFTIFQTEQPLAHALQSGYPEVESASRMAATEHFLLTAGENRIIGTKGAFADPSFLKQFSFPLLAGQMASQLNDPHGIVITEKLARKLFGTTDAIQKTIKIDSTDFFTVTGVLKDLPGNTRFEFEYLLSWEYFKKLGWANDNWLSNSVSTFVLLKPKADIISFNNKIKDITRKQTKREDVWTHFLHPLSKWHLYSGFENGVATGGRIDSVKTFALIAIFILAIACINFMNLSTAGGERRSKEVGIRKTAGAAKTLLVQQFMTESFLYSTIACILALIIVQLSLPFFNSTIDSALNIPFESPGFWLAAFALIFLSGLLAGAYPAVYLSSFKPLGILKPKMNANGQVLSLRKVLVVVQFCFGVILIVSTLVVSKQIQFAQQRQLGFSSSQLIYLPLSGQITENFEVIKQELLTKGVATAVSRNMSPITERGANTWGLQWPGKSSDFDETIALYSTDADLAKTAGLQITQGRDIDIYSHPADSSAVILNETAAAVMKFDNPIGQIITESSSGRKWHVVGTVKDFVINSPYDKIPPLVIQGAKSWYTTMHVKLNAANSMTENLARCSEIFNKYNPAFPFDFKFADDEYARKFKEEKQSRLLVGLFASLAIFISCLGLFGLTAYMAERRVKEIGVRKVLGASTFSIIRLMSGDFIRLIMIAILIALPVSWMIMNNWLLSFPYRINMGIEVMILAGLMAISIALITISFQSIQAAVRNPVKSLRVD
jgi:putative ABC transport system permease protein